MKFYSVLVEGHDTAEFIDFLDRMRKSHPTQLGELLQIIREIGNVYGAETRFFRPERDASALPPPRFQYVGDDDEDPDNQYGLRLYCLRLNDTVVILFNGDLKTAKTAQECLNCKRHFEFANRVTRRIDEGIAEKVITSGNRNIDGFELFEFEI